MNHIRSSRAVLSVALVAACLATVGCGTAEYSNQLSRRLNQLQTAAPFQTLFAPTNLEGTPVKLRVPMVFKTSFVEDSAHPEDGAKIDPTRLQPPFLQLPGFKVCYETNANSSDGNMPYYCYLAAAPTQAAGDAGRIEADLLARLKAAFKDAPGSWETVNCPTPDGRSVAWKKVRVSGDQEFRLNSVKTDFKPAKVNMPGVFELWAYDAGQCLVLVGWRCPTAVEGSAAPAEPAPGGANPAAPTLGASKFDMSSVPPLTAGSIVVEGAPPAG